MNTRARPMSMATDGQGVILATPHSMDARQRTASDLLARRVAHRLGCPAAVGQVQQGVLHLDAPLKELYAKGAREIVVAPLWLAPAPMVTETTSGRREGAPYATGVVLREAEPLGGQPEVIEALVEALDNSERTPDADTRIVMLVPHSDHPVLTDLTAHVECVRAAGWRGGVVVAMPPNQANCGLNGALAVAPHESVLLVPLTIAPGPFSTRIADCAQQLGVQSASVSLHSSEALTRLICRRVTAARRA